MKKETKTFRITEQEIKTLLFWALVGGGQSRAGQYGHLLPETISKWFKKCNLKVKDNLPYIDKNKLLARDILERVERDEDVEKRNRAKKEI